MTNVPEERVPVFAIARHRMNLDGDGIVTLVTFLDCPLRCRYCINPASLSSRTKHLLLTPRELYDRVRRDNLYFLASGGGVTFGGGEPLLRSGFLTAFRAICGEGWRLCAETSLAVPRENVEAAAGAIDRFFVDIKDADPAIYRAYTGRDNILMRDNLTRLAAMIPPDRITVRVPLIPGFNREEDREKSLDWLRGLGLKQFDCFTYTVRKKAAPRENAEP